MSKKCEPLLISIIIPTRNRCICVEKLLKSISAQEADPNLWEVIVIDNGSTDNTQKVCENCGKRIKNFKYIYDDRPGLHIGRNRGMVESSGEVIAYLDDDVILFHEWLKTAIEVFNDKDTMAANGCAIPGNLRSLPDYVRREKIRINGFEVIQSISCFWERNISEEMRNSRLQVPYLLFGCNVLYRREILEKCKGFHPDGMPWDMIAYRGDGETPVAVCLQNIGAKIIYNSQLSVYHMIDKKRLTRESIRKNHYRTGVSEMYTALRNEERGVKSIKNGLKEVLNGIVDIDINKEKIDGEIFLLFHYIFRKEIRDWVHKEDYL